MSAIDLFCLPLSIAFRRFGIAMAAMIPMIATTIRSSMSVNPACLLDFIMSGVPPLLPGQEQEECHSPDEGWWQAQAADSEGVAVEIPTMTTSVSGGGAERSWQARVTINGRLPLKPRRHGARPGERWQFDVPLEPLYFWTPCG